MKRADGGANIVMKHYNIQGNDMPEYDRGSLRVTDDASKEVQKTPNRVALDTLLDRVTGKEYIHPDSIPHMTICVLLTDNGFAIVGKSSPADPENYDEALGEKFAFEDAIRQMWPLEAYLLRERMMILAEDGKE